MKKSILFCFCFFIILSGEVVVGQVNSVEFFQDNELWGLKNSDGKVLVPPKYENFNEPYFGAFYSDFAIVKQNGKYGFIDTNGIDIFPIYFDEFSMVHYGDFVEVNIDNKWGLVNLKSKKIVLPIIYDGIKFLEKFYSYLGEEKVDFNNASFLVNTILNSLNETRYGLVLLGDTSYLEIHPPVYDEIIKYKSTIILKKNKKYGCSNLNGKINIPLVYSYLNFDNNLNMYLACLGEGTKVQNSGWSDDYYFSGGKWGFINKENQVIIPFEYDYVRPKPNKSEDTTMLELIKVGLNNKYGMIDTKGKIVIPLKYDDIDNNIFSYNDFMDLDPYYDKNG